MRRFSWIKMPFDSLQAGFQPTFRSPRTLDLQMACHERTLRFAEGEAQGESSGGQGRN